MYDLYKIFQSEDTRMIGIIVKRLSEDKLQIFNLNENKLIGDPFAIENFHKEKDVFVYETMNGNIENVSNSPSILSILNQIMKSLTSLLRIIYF